MYEVVFAMYYFNVSLSNVDMFYPRIHSFFYSYRFFYEQNPKTIELGMCE